MVIKDPGFSQKVTPHGTPPSPSEWTEITVPDHWLTLKVRIIERLRNWVKEGQDINALMPYLCAYMGHSDTRCTEYYLRLTAELYPEIVAKCERYFEGTKNEE